MSEIAYWRDLIKAGLKEERPEWDIRSIPHGNLSTTYQDQLILIEPHFDLCILPPEGTPDYYPLVKSYEWRVSVNNNIRNIAIVPFADPKMFDKIIKLIEDAKRRRDYRRRKYHDAAHAALLAITI